MDERTYIHIKTNGSADAFTVGPHDNELRMLQEMVGGYIEAVPVPGFEAFLYVNEEGVLKGLPANPGASTLARQALVGDAVLVGGLDGDGETRGLDRFTVQLLVALGYV